MPTPSPFEYLGQRGLRWTLGASTFEALPRCGARLMRWQHNGQEIIHWPQNRPSGQPIDAPAHAEEIPGTYGGNPILFPFPSRCYEGGESLHWRTPDGRRLPMPVHGIANQGRFEELSLSAPDGTPGFCARFQPDAEANRCYPFDYAFTVVYSFAPLQITCELSLLNRSLTQSIPWSPGHHFYFALPFAKGLGRSDHFVKIDAAKTAIVRGANAGNLQPVPTFANATALDNPDLAAAPAHYALRSNKAELFCKRPDTRRITVYHSEAPVPPHDYTYTTWSPAEAPFYCIEPWAGPSNAPGHGVGLHSVGPGQKQTFRVRVVLTPP